MNFSPEQRRAITLELLQSAQSSRELQQRWDYLTAAHIVGQTILALHWRTHQAMLTQAFVEGDWREVIGQLLRLFLVPLGHAVNRLPIGNTGRSRTSAFEPMPISTTHRFLIEQSVASTNQF